VRKPTALPQMNSPFLLPMTVGLMALSIQLLSISGGLDRRAE